MEDMIYAAVTKAGRLSVVGVGIKLAAQTSLEAKAHIEAADQVFYLVTDPGTKYWLQSLNKKAVSLQSFYKDRETRLETYLDIVEHIMQHVRQGYSVCAVFYGHPGIFVFPSHRAIEAARREGFNAQMLPGISAEDCLFADIGLDPARTGCQSFEATDFLVFERQFDPHSALVLWQVGVLGEVGYKSDLSQDKLDILKDRLLKVYPPDQPAYIYEAARFPICDPVILKSTIDKLTAGEFSAISTVLIPPISGSIPNLMVASALGIPDSFIQKRAEMTRAELERIGAE